MSPRAVRMRVPAAKQTTISVPPWPSLIAVRFCVPLGLVSVSVTPPLVTLRDAVSGS